MADKAPKYIVTAPLVAVTVAKDLRYLSRGAPVPSDVDEEHLKALVDLGFISEIKVVEEVQVNTVVVPEGDPEDSPKWTKEALARYAEVHGVVVPTTAKNKADIVEVLLAAKADAGTTPAS